MHRAIAAWLTANPWRAVLTCAACGALSPFLPFLILSCAIPVLLAFRAAPRLAIGAAIVSSLGWLLLPTDTPGLWIPVGIMLFFAPVLLALLARTTRSLQLCFQIAVLGCALAVVLPHVLLDDPVGWWSGLMQQAVQQMQAAGIEMQGGWDAFIDRYSRSMWGLLASVVLSTVLGALFLGRWWASLVTVPGEFGAEFQALRAGNVLGGMIAAAIVAALLTKSPLTGSLAWVGFTTLVVQGLAAAHRSKALGRMNGRWLVAIYVFLVVLPLSSIACLVLAAWGFADNWRRPRVRTV